MDFVASVHIVNNDIVVNSLIMQTLKLINVVAYDYVNANDLLDNLPLVSPSCCLVDFVLPDMSGLELMYNLRQRECYQPCLFMSAKVVPEMLVSAMNKGAFGFVKRPFIAEKMLEMVLNAINKDKKQAVYIDSCKQYIANILLLSTREREIFEIMLKQVTSRQIAGYLNISHRTVENHRRKILSKLKVKDVGDLVRYQTIRDVLGGFDVVLT